MKHWPGPFVMPELWPEAKPVAIYYARLPKDPAAGQIAALATLREAPGPANVDRAFAASLYQHAVSMVIYPMTMLGAIEESLRASVNWGWTRELHEYRTVYHEEPAPLQPGDLIHIPYDQTLFVWLGETRGWRKEHAA